MAMTHEPRTLPCAALALLLFACGLGDALAHGERNQEPFLRMRTIQWYDVTWSRTAVQVNGEVEVAGKLHVFEDWPHNLPEPKTAFLGNGTPGPVLVRTESYLDGVPMIQSTSLQTGRDYAFRTVLKGRIPGRHHVHPMLNVEGAGSLLGPGRYVEVGGDAAAFALPLNTLDGTHIDNLETWGTSTVYAWHGLWAVVGLGWLLWWLRRPLFIPRYAAIEAGRADALVTPEDRRIAAGLLVGTLITVYAAYQWTESRYPRTVPLQRGRPRLQSLPVAPHTVKAKHVAAHYDVPGRSMKLDVDITNTLDRPVRIGEFTSANLRFVARDVPAAVAGVARDYPAELVPNAGLAVRDNSPIAPGETRRVHLEATDAAWEAERLTSLINDPDNRYGGLIFLFDDSGARHIASVSGPIVPVFLR